MSEFLGTVLGVTVGVLAWDALKWSVRRLRDWWWLRRLRASNWRVGPVVDFVMEETFSGPNDPSAIRAAGVRPKRKTQEESPPR